MRARQGGGRGRRLRGLSVARLPACLPVLYGGCLLPSLARYLARVSCPTRCPPPPSPPPPPPPRSAPPVQDCAAARVHARAAHRAGGRRVPVPRVPPGLQALPAHRLLGRAAGARGGPGQAQLASRPAGCLAEQDCARAVARRRRRPPAASSRHPCHPCHSPGPTPACRPPLPPPSPQVNVFALGAVFLQLAKLLRLTEHPMFAKPVDPSLYIHRFADRLDFGRQMHAVRGRGRRQVRARLEALAARGARRGLAGGARGVAVCGGRPAGKPQRASRRGASRRRRAPGRRRCARPAPRPSCAPPPPPHPAPATHPRWPTPRCAWWPP